MQSLRRLEGGIARAPGWRAAAGVTSWVQLAPQPGSALGPPVSWLRCWGSTDPGAALPPPSGAVWGGASRSLSFLFCKTRISRWLGGGKGGGPASPSRAERSGRAHRSVTVDESRAAGGLVRAGGQRCLFCLPSRTQKNVFILELETSSLDDTESSRTPFPQVPLLLKSYFTGVRCHGQGPDSNTSLFLTSSLFRFH